MCNKKYLYILILLAFECNASDNDSFDGLDEKNLAFSIENLPHANAVKNDVDIKDLSEKSRYPYKNHRGETLKNSILKREGASVEVTGVNSAQDANEKVNDQNTVASSFHGSCSPPHNNSTKTYTLSLSGSDRSKKSTHLNQSCIGYEEYSSRGKEYFKDVVEKVVEEQEGKVVSAITEEKKDTSSTVIESTDQKKASIKSSSVIAASRETEGGQVQQQREVQQEVKEAESNSCCYVICNCFFSC